MVQPTPRMARPIWKVEGTDVTVAPRPKKPARVVNLVKALEESLRAARPARKAARRRRAA